MTAFVFLVKGIAIGLAIAAPVGPIGVLCIRRALTLGPRAAIVSGLGAAVADAVYGAIAAFGLVWVTDLLLAQQTPLRLLGGLVLIGLGVRTWRAAPPDAAPAMPDRELGAFVATFALTLTNPATILSFAAVFAGLGLVAGDGYGDAAALVLGVFLGSALWWLCLGLGVGRLRTRLDRRRLRWVNRLSGGVLAGFGLLALASLL